MKDSKEEFVAKVMSGLAARKDYKREKEKHARIIISRYKEDRWSEYLRRRTKLVKQGRKP